MNLTREQSVLLGTALANPGMVIATTADSPNDLVWMDLVEKGVLEIVDFDDPNMIKIAGPLDLRGYRPTQRAIDYGARLEKVTDAEIMQLRFT
jgi:hypothetical protein